MEFQSFFQKKKQKKSHPSSPNPQITGEVTPIPQTYPQAIHLLQSEAQKSPSSFYQTLHRLHQTIGNQAVAQIFRSAQKEPEVDSAQAFKHATSGGGREIPYRQEMESHFGTSFQNVKAYAGGKAQHGMDALGAEAAAFSNKVAFRTANPSKETVAHELTHVIQQGGHEASLSIPQKMDVSHPSDPAELEADSVGKNYK